MDVRKQLRLLRHPIHLSPPFDSSPPEPVLPLVQVLSEPPCEYVPARLRDWIKSSTHETEIAPDHTVDFHSKYDDAEIAAWKKYADDLQNPPEVLLELINRAFELDTSSGSMLSIQESGSLSIAKGLLPFPSGSPIPSVKTDFLLQINPKHPNVARIFSSFFSRNPETSLSAFDDAIASKTLTGAIIIFTSGTLDDGIYRFSVTSAAILARLSGLRKSGGFGDLVQMPVIGWVVHCRDWYLLLAYQQDGPSTVWRIYPIEGVY